MKRSVLILSFLLLGCLPTKIDTLPQEKVFFKKTHLTVEIAADKSSQKKGLMFRKSLPEDEGMLFDFGRAGVYRFWMKNTVLPLSIAFLDESGKVLAIEDMDPNTPEKLYMSPPETRFAIEVNQGWYGRHRVKIGDIAKLPVTDINSPSPS